MSEVKRFRFVDTNGYPAIMVCDSVKAERFVEEQEYDRLAVALEAEQRLTASDERADVLEGLLRRVIDSGQLFNYSSIGEELEVDICAALKPAEGLDRRDMAAKVHLMKRQGGGDEY